MRVDKNNPIMIISVVATVIALLLFLGSFLFPCSFVDLLEVVDCN